MFLEADNVVSLYLIIVPKVDNSIRNSQKQLKLVNIFFFFKKCIIIAFNTERTFNGND